LNVINNDPATRHPCSWTPIPQRDVRFWNSRLLQSDASIYQYPLFNDTAHFPMFKPRYLVCTKDDREVAFACINTFDLLGFKFGFVRDGPASLVTGVRPGLDELQTLLDWADDNRYTFLKLSNENQSVLSDLLVNRQSARVDPFPLFGSLSRHRHVVELTDDDSEMLSRFQRIARRDIRNASAAGFQIASTTHAAALESYWPLVRKLERRKGFSYRRGLKSYKQMMQMAADSNSARLFTVDFKGRPVNVVLVVRDRMTAHYLVGALDVDALGDAPTPNTLVHWTAMREFRAMGVRRYSFFGGNPKSRVSVFKEKFNPIIEDLPPPVNVILYPRRYKLFQHIYAAASRIRNKRPSLTL